MAMTEHEIRTTKAGSRTRPRTASSAASSRRVPPRPRLGDRDPAVRSPPRDPELRALLDPRPRGRVRHPCSAATWDGVVKEIFAEYIGEEQPTGSSCPIPSRSFRRACSTSRAEPVRARSRGTGASPRRTSSGSTCRRTCSSSPNGRRGHPTVDLNARTPSPYRSKTPRSTW